MPIALRTAHATASVVTNESLLLPRFRARSAIRKQIFSKVQDFSRQAKEAGAELIVFPEMTDTGYSMPVIENTPIIGKPALLSAYKTSPINFPWRSSVAYPNARDHRSTIPKFWLMRRATSLRNIAKLICMRSHPWKNRRVSLRAIPSRPLRSAVCILGSASATTFAFLKYTES